VTEGELWTRRILAELRAAGFRPRAWIRFLAASFERAALERRSHGAAHRRVLVGAGAGVVVWGAVAALGRPGLALAGIAWHLSLALMVDWHLGMLERRDGSALDGLGRANAITLVRAAAIPALFALDESGLLLGLVLLAGLDVLDGVVARRLDERTRLGAWLDGSTDTLIGLAVALAAFRLAVVPGLLVALVLLRVGVPWILLLRAYFLTPCPFAMEGGLRDEGLAARVPGVVAAVGVGLALAGTEIGVPLAILGVSASIGQAFVAVVGVQRGVGSER